jgi:hypothetical protein
VCKFCENRLPESWSLIISLNPFIDLVELETTTVTVSLWDNFESYRWNFINSLNMLLKVHSSARNSQIDYFIRFKHQTYVIHNERTPLHGRKSTLRKPTEITRLSQRGPFFSFSGMRQPLPKVRVQTGAVTNWKPRTDWGLETAFSQTTSTSTLIQTEFRPREIAVSEFVKHTFPY